MYDKNGDISICFELPILSEIVPWIYTVIR